MELLNITDNSTIHTGISYDRIQHAERIEDLYINPSNLYRVAECPASARKICRASDKIKQSARMGLTVDRIVTESIEQGKAPREVAPEASPEMIRQAEGYWRRLHKLIELHPDAEVYLEMELTGNWIPDFRGISDCVIYVPSLKRLIVVDHKTGSNPEYTADDVQLKCYAVMAYDALSAKGLEISDIYRMIIQPDSRDRATRTVYAPASAVSQWRAEIDAIVTRAEQNPGKANPGCYRCLFCPWAANCGALAAFDEANDQKFTKFKTRVLRA